MNPDLPSDNRLLIFRPPRMKYHTRRLAGVLRGGSKVDPGCFVHLFLMDIQIFVKAARQDSGSGIQKCFQWVIPIETTGSESGTDAGYDVVLSSLIRQIMKYSQSPT